MLLVSRALVLEEVPRVKVFVAQKLERVAVKIACTGFRDGFDGCRAVAPVLSAVIRGQDFYLGHGIDVRIGVERAVAAVIHVVAAVELPVVVLGASAIDAESDVAVNANRTFVLARLIANTWNEGDELREITAIQDKLVDLLVSDRAR